LLYLVSCFLCGLIYSPLVECIGPIILASWAIWFVRRFVSHCFGYDPCCFIMVFISSIDVTFSCLVSTPVLRWVALVIHIFLIVDGEWVLLMIIDDYSCSCGFCAYVICTLTCFIVWMAYDCLEICLSSFDKTLDSSLQGEFMSFVELDAWFDSPWF
jgi:hypothetical protein